MDGFEIYDINGKLQVNDQFLTYALKSTGVANVENRKVGNTCQTSLLLPDNFYNCLVALGGGGGYAAAYAGNYTLNGSARRIFATNGAPAGTQFTYFVYQRSDTIPATNFGLEVRNTSNQITFSSNQRTMRVTNIIGGVVNNGEQTVSYGAKQLAFAQGAWSGHRISGPIQTYGGGSGQGGQGGPIVADPDSPHQAGYQYSWSNDGKIYGGYIQDGGQTVGTRMCSWDDVTIGPGSDYNQPPDMFLPLNLFVVDVTGVPIGATFF